MVFQVTVRSLVVAKVELLTDGNDILKNIVSTVTVGKLNLQLGPLKDKINLRFQNVTNRTHAISRAKNIRLVSVFDEDLRKVVKQLPNDIPFFFEWTEK